MGPDQFNDELSACAGAIFALAAPLLALAAGLGLLIAILQAATQVQEQTISQIVKIFAISAMLYGFGAALATPLVVEATHIFNDFPAMTR